MVVSTGYVFETRGGAIIGEFEPSSVSWQWAGDPAETLDVTIQLEGDPRNWRNLASEWNHCLAWPIGGGRYVGGPIMPHDFDDDARTLTLSARGIRVLLEREYVLPFSALTVGLVDSAGRPLTSQDTTVGNVDYGTIGKRILQQLQQWPSWDEVPITYHADRVGNRTQTYSALDLYNIAAAWDDLSAFEFGPDIRMELVRTDADHFGWRYRSGTESAPRIQSESMHTWELGRASQLKIKTDPSGMASVAWSIGGRSEDQALVASLYDPTTVELGGMLMHLKTDAPTNTSDVRELRKYNVEALRTSLVPAEFWTFRVPADESPLPHEYAPGDLCTVQITEAEPTAGGYRAPGEYKRRIAALAGTEDGRWVSITCGEFYG